MRFATIGTVALVGCMAAMFAPGTGFGQTTPHQHPSAAQTKPATGMDPKCQAMMAEHDKMFAETKAADARLDSLVASMNAATGQPKIEATAVVVSEMVAQRKAMRDGMMTLQVHMMSHMMEHMQKGKDSMASCPMMKMMSSGGKH